MSRIAFFAGSFNPFTTGHLNIVERALALFDDVIIGIGYNISKPEAQAGAGSRQERIAALYAGNPRVSVITYAGLTAEAARDAGAAVLVRGVRDTRDFEYERSIAEVNRRLFGIDTVLFPADTEVGCVSSSMVRELAANGFDVSRFIP